MHRKNKYSKLYQLKEFAEEWVLMVVVSDLNNDLLLEHLENALATEDFEYCESIAAEAAVRGLPIHSKIKEFLNG